jgi:ribosomal protein S18 acetylase RimI-like enzyme
VGIAQYFMDSASRFADVGFLVRDAWQGRGLGRLLVDEMIGLARERGVVGFTADVLATNQAMLHLFRRSGLTVNSVLEGEIYRLTMPFADEAGPDGA